MANYYRITAYHPTEDYCFIVDSHGRFEKIWEFSSYLVNKGVKVLEVANGDTFLDGNMRRAKDTQDTPLVTVEYSLSQKKVLQCYADHNTKPAEDVLHYVNKVWLPYANRTLKQIAA